MAGRCIFGADKEKVANKIKSIRLINVKKESEKSIKLVGDVLEFRCAYAAGLNGAFSDGEIREFWKTM